MQASFVFPYEILVHYQSSGYSALTISKLRQPDMFEESKGAGRFEQRVWTASEGY